MRINFLELWDLESVLSTTSVADFWIFERRRETRDLEQTCEKKFWKVD